jgi:hypothetical protein
LLGLINVEGGGSTEALKNATTTNASDGGELDSVLGTSETGACIELSSEISPSEGPTSEWSSGPSGFSCVESRQPKSGPARIPVLSLDE